MQPNQPPTQRNPNRPLVTSWVQLSASTNQSTQVAQSGGLSQRSSLSSSSSSGPQLGPAIQMTGASQLGSLSSSGGGSPLAIRKVGDTSLMSASSSTSTSMHSGGGSAFHSVTSSDSSGDFGIKPTTGRLHHTGPASILSNSQQQDQKSKDSEQTNEEENRKLRLQLYVFVLRCISYPFNAKQNDLHQHQRHQQLKLRKSQLELITQLHSRYLKSLSTFSSKKYPHSRIKLTQTQLKQLDESYELAHETFSRKFLQTDRMRGLVESECCSQSDLRDLFRCCIEKELNKCSVVGPTNSYQQQQAWNSSELTNTSRVASVSLSGTETSADFIGSVNRETVINLWLMKFEQIIREDQDSSVHSTIIPSSSVSLPDPTSSISTNLANTSSQQQQQQQPLSKDQLYQMFQNILNIKKFEHQLLYNALQLDSSDEQAAAIRRELDGRISRIAELERNKKLMPKFVLKEMESLYFEELRMSVNKLMINLDNLPVMKGGQSGGNESRVGYGLQKFRRYNSRAQASLARDGLVESHPSEPTLTKLDVVLTFHIEVIVMEARGIRQLAPNREIYCTMEIEGSEKLQTEHVQAKKPLWDTQGDFTTNHPLPVLKIKLYAVNPSMLSLEDKELGRLVVRPTVLSPKTPEWFTMQVNSSSAPSDRGSGSAGGTSSSSGGGQSDEELKIRATIRMDRPQQLKHCGYLYGIGKSTWRTLKRRYHILIQVSQYTFVMCSYKDKKAKPTEMLQLESYTVDFIEPPTDLIMEHCAEIATSEHHHHGSSSSSTFGLAGRLANVILKQQNQSTSVGSLDQSASDSGAGWSGEEPQQPASAIQTAAALSDELHNKFYFNVVKEGDSVVFACDDEQECFGWVMALYRATGQAHKPTPIRDQYSGSTSHYLDAAFAYQNSAYQPAKLVGSGVSSSSGLSGLSMNGTKGSLVDAANQRARKHGMDEFISADPCKFQHSHLFRHLQNETLKYRLEDSYCSLGWFSQSQVFVLDEYCARYGVRTCYRHLAYLDSLLDFTARGYFIDHTLLNYGYDFCASHVSGNSGQAHPISLVNFDLRPDGIGTVTVEERDLFHTIKSKLLKMIERQISNFSQSFPFGKPEGALKAALSLLERVLLKQEHLSSSSVIQNEDVRNLIRRCLEQAALNCYTKLTDTANLADQPPPNSILFSSYSISNSPTQVADQILGLQREPDSSLLSGRTSRITPTEATRATSNLSNSSICNSSLASAGSISTTGSTNSGSTDMASGSGAISIASDSTTAKTHKTNKQQCLTMAMIINSDQFKPKEKLRYLIRLAEICCELVEENNEYFSEAFAWHSDLMMDHFELFWSLFSVDMDKILSELKLSTSSISDQNQSLVSSGPMSLAPVRGASADQPLLGTANRDLFALFQVLNNHLLKSSNIECRKFRQYLCDTYKPKLLRYIGIMEATLGRMLHKACEKEGQINCSIMEQMFIKLDDLQKFVLNQLKWPEGQLAEQLRQRLKLMAYELCEASLARTLQNFQRLESKSSKWTSTATSCASPTEMIQMIGLVLETRHRSQTLCTFNNLDQMSYHSKVDQAIESALGEMQAGLMSKMLYALESTLTKLARYDEGNLLAPILSLTSKQGMSSSGRDIGKQYVTFVFNCCDLLRNKINDELWIVNLLEEWYTAQMNIICTWLGERIDRSLHDVQLVALLNIVPKIHHDMSLQGIAEDKLNLKSYQTIMNRLKMDEASVLASCSPGPSAGSGQNQSEQASSIFSTSILSSLTSSGSSNQATQATPNTSSSNIGGSSTLTAVGSSPTPSANITAPHFGSSPSPGSSKLTQHQQQPVFASSNRFEATPTRRFELTQQADKFQQEPQQQQQDSDNNLADRALQSATRMFRGFWTN